MDRSVPKAQHSSIGPARGKRKPCPKRGHGQPIDAGKEARGGPTRGVDVGGQNYGTRCG
jgi:hypothetical protein